MKAKSQIAGILSIIAGVFGILWLAGSWFSIYVVRYMFMSSSYGAPPRELYEMMAAIYLSFGVFGAILGVFGIVGGIFALKKRHWGWALTGAIAAVITFFPTGIASLIFLSMGRDEFRTSQQVDTQ